MIKTFSGIKTTGKYFLDSWLIQLYMNTREKVEVYPFFIPVPPGTSYLVETHGRKYVSFLGILWCFLRKYTFNILMEIIIQRSYPKKSKQMKNQLCNKVRQFNLVKLSEVWVDVTFSGQFHISVSCFAISGASRVQNSHANWKVPMVQMRACG